MTNRDAVPLLVGPANCEAVLGVPWRRARDLAIALGVRRVKLGRALVLPAAELLAALERPRPEPSPDDPRAAALRALGR